MARPTVNNVRCVASVSRRAAAQQVRRNFVADRLFTIATAHCFCTKKWHSYSFWNDLISGSTGENQLKNIIMEKF